MAAAFYSGGGFHTPALGPYEGYETRLRYLMRTTYLDACVEVVDCDTFPLETYISAAASYFIVKRHKKLITIDFLQEA